MGGNIFREKSDIVGKQTRGEKCQEQKMTVCKGTGDNAQQAVLIFGDVVWSGSRVIKCPPPLMPIPDFARPISYPTVILFYQTPGLDDETYTPT